MPRSWQMSDSPAPIVVADGRRVVRVTGDDRRTFLDATLSQSVGDLTPGRATSALWLDIHGAPLAAFDVVALPQDDALLLVTPTEGLAAITDQLAMRTFLSAATFEVDTAVVVGVRVDAMDASSISMVASPGTAVVADGVTIVGRRDGLDLIGDVTAVGDWLGAAGLPEPSDDVGALRDFEIRNGEPRLGAEIVAPHLPEEAGVLATHVHLAKGCYPGQEAVARMWMLGKPRRRLVVLDLDGPAQDGDEVGTGRDRVTVTRATRTAPWAALAYAPSTVIVGSTVQAAKWKATVGAIVGADLPQPGADPKVTRRRDRRAAAGA